jgi:hypothetical protein
MVSYSIFDEELVVSTSMAAGDQFQGTFSEHSGNIQGTFREHCTFSEYSVNMAVGDRFPQDAAWRGD